LVGGEPRNPPDGGLGGEQVREELPSDSRPLKVTGKDFGLTTVEPAIEVPELPGDLEVTSNRTAPRGMPTAWSWAWADAVETRPKAKMRRDRCTAGSYRE
jgi:hypothetical protein